MNTQRLDDAFLTWLASELEKREPPTDGSAREASWLDANQIASWWEGEPRFDAETVDRALLAAWENEPDRFAEFGIRPAKYPSFGLWRLWGHESVVGRRDRDSIWQRRLDEPRVLPGPTVAAGAAPIFVSHSMLDLDFAVRVRGSLAALGLRPWLAIERIQRGEPICETVRRAVQSAHASVVLIGRGSLGSAWVHTEFVGGKAPIVVTDGADGELMELLESWRSPAAPGCGATATYRVDLIAPLEAAYRGAWRSGRHPATQPALDGCTGGTSIFPQRPEKFATTARALLAVLGGGPCCVHPGRPAHWPGDAHFRDFRAVVEPYARSGSPGSP